MTWDMNKENNIIGEWEMAMYFVQHGLALAKEVDPDRPLSGDGRKEVTRISVYLRDVGFTVKKIYHSGKTRAKETAQIFAEYVGDGNTYELPGMNPNDDVTQFATGLNEDEAMYVGHLPHMEKLVSYLITGNENASIAKFTNGGVVCVIKDGIGFHIDWYLIPSMCKV